MIVFDEKPYPPPTPTHETLRRELQSGSASGELKTDHDRYADLSL